MDRRTYLATQQSHQDIIEYIENQLKFVEPINKSIFAYFSMNPIVAVQPENFINVYQKITRVLIQRPQYLRELVLTALEPSQLNISSTRQPYISANILTNCPKLILYLLQRGNQALVLFDFLRIDTNQTSLGYFNKIFNHQSEQFQNYVIKFFAGSSLILQKCFANCRFSQVTQVLFNSLAKSQDIGLIEFKKQIFLRFLSLTKNVKGPHEILQNVLQMLNLILQNILVFKQELLQMIFDSISPYLIEQLGQIILLYYNTHPIAVQYQIRILISIIAMYKIIKTKKLNFNIDNLKNVIIKIIDVFQSLMQILKDKPQQKYRIQNNESVIRVGLVRYYLLNLFRDILLLDEQIVIKHFKFNKQKHEIIQIYLCLNKWNNMIHFLVEQCALLLLKYQRVLEQKQKYTRCKQFLDFIIQQYKASQYIFLGTGNNASYGNIYYIYNIGRAVAVQLQNTSQLQKVIKDFKPLQKFITDDLQKFQIKMDTSLSNNSFYIVKSKPDSIKKLVRKMSTRDIQVHLCSNNKSVILEDEVADFMDKKLKKLENKNNHS